METTGPQEKRRALIDVRRLAIGYGNEPAIMRNLNFSVSAGEIFIIMGGSGCGKSSLLRCLIGLLRPRSGEVLLFGKKLNDAAPRERDALLRRIGVMYQGGALWSSMTLLENVSLPLEEYTTLNAREREEVARCKLALVGLSAAAEKILFFDEPGAGLDPIASKELDDLTLNIRESLGTTIVIVTHELDSIFAVGDRALFLDAKTKTAGALGAPRELLASGREDIRRFLTRAGTMNFS